jgi:two-component system, NarL family, sensor histidine kinase UhpB
MSQPGDGARLGMDLRRKLTARLCLLALAMLLSAGLLALLAIWEDVQEEMEASSNLAKLMLVVSQADARGDSELRALLAHTELRHLRLDWFDAQQPLDVWVSDEHAASKGVLSIVAQAIERWMFDRHPGVEGVQYLFVGEDLLVIRPDPRSEIEEILTASARTLVLLLSFVAAMIMATWLMIGRALAPVRALQQGLARLATGAEKADLPHFELREFDQVARSIDGLASSLTRAREAERAVSRRLVNLQESERAELARELHDEFGQALTAIGVAAAYLERHGTRADPSTLQACVRDIRSQVEHMSAHVRGLLGELRPHGLEGLGLVDALHDLVSGWSRRVPEIELTLDWPVALPWMDQEASLAIYRTLQEVLTNVQRHSCASRLHVALHFRDGALVLRAHDNGRGCAGASQPMLGGGLTGMRERAHFAGGSLSFFVPEPSGFGVELCVPVVAPNPVDASFSEGL